MPTPSRWSGSPTIKGSTEQMQMALLTFSLIGLQFTWGLEMTYATPYLLQIGLKKSTTAIVWIAGPLSGLIMQPVVGAIADRSTSKYGRRRPFMIVSSVVVGFALFVLGWTAEVVGIFVSTESTRKNATIILAVLSIYVVDFAINVVQACCRSLIVDTLPIAKQQAGSAWAARMSASGHVVGYVIGTLDLVAIFPQWMGGNTQFKKMTVIAAMGLWGAVGLTSWAVTERVLLQSSDAKSSIYGVLVTLWKRTLNLPPRIQAICWVQFWSWIGWFPFLFYSSTWVGETYYRYEHPALEAGEDGNHDALGNIGRLGSTALVIFSLITFASSVGLPYVVRAPTASQGSGAGKFTPRPPPSLVQSAQALLLGLARFQPDLVTAWTLSNLCFAAIMIWAPFVRSLSFATLLVALAGVPWAISCWAPFAEMGVEINRLSSSPDGTIRVRGPTATSRGGYTAVRPSIERDDDQDLEMDDTPQSPLHRRSSSGVLHLHHEDDPDALSSTGELAGVYLGVLNVYTTLPQFVGTFVSWIVFSILEPDKNKVSDDDPDHHKWLDLKKNGPNAIAVCLFVGAVCAVVAAEAGRRLKMIS